MVMIMMIIMVNNGRGRQIVRFVRFTGMEEIVKGDEEGIPNWVAFVCSLVNTSGGAAAAAHARQEPRRR